MTISYSLTSVLREKLKEPIGTLIRGSFSDTIERFKEMIEKERSPFIISVGDTVSKNLAKINMSPKLAIVDNVCMRRTVTEPVQLTTEKTVYVKNPQAKITAEAILAIQDALTGDFHVKIVVDGEEDLLALIAILYAPDNAYVLYGQPYEGIVVVRVTSDKRSEVARILEQMNEGSKS